MGPRALAVIVLLAARTASAGDPECAPLPGRGRPSATCFDLGNRLTVSGAWDLDGPAFELGLQLRHYVGTEDPAVNWRFEHRGLQAASGVGRWEALLYEGRFLRHSRDGHLVLPTNPPKKIFLPFDVGVEVVLGRARGLVEGEDFELEVVRSVAMIDLARSDDFRRRLALGPVAAWDMTLSRSGMEVDAIQGHVIVPFSTVQLALYAEDRRGLTQGKLAVEGGAAWSNQTGWGRRVIAEASVERIFMAINDRPISIYLAGRFSEPEGVLAQAGLRLALVSSGR